MLNVAPAFDPDYPFREVTDDAGLYHLRHGEAPGRWMGTGAAELGLAGQVTPAALRALFAGKHPATGAYLASARGSAGRAAARAGTDCVDVAAAAARLDLSPTAVRARLRSGALAGERVVGGEWRVPVEAIDAWLEGRPQPPAPGPLPSPAPDGTYALAQAARLAGVSRAYLARLVAEAAPAVTRREDGRPVQYLVGRRDERGHWRVAAEELDRFVASRGTPRAVPAYDLAIRAPKSVSILHALAPLVPREALAARGLPEDLAAQVLAAHRAGVADVVGLLERHAAWIRGPGGRVQARGLTIAAFEHRSSRAGDPLTHTHLVVANVARGVDNRVGALDGTAFYAWARAAGHVYQARLRAELVRRLGVAFEDPHNGVADLVGVPRAVIEEFSERSRQVAELLAKLGAAGPRAAQAAVLATRAPKDGHAHQSPEQLAERAAKLGFRPEDLVTEVLGRGPRWPARGRRVAEVAEALAGPEGLTARATRVDRRDALCGFATAMAEGATGAELERWATALLADPHRFVPVMGPGTRGADVIRRADGRMVRSGGVERTYSTPELLAQEARLVAAHAEGLGPESAGVGWGVARAEALAVALARRPSLRAEQAAMVEAVTTSGVGVEVVVGGPGTGKTFALGAAAEAWRGSGFRVIGAALQGGAAEVLAAEAGLDERRTLTALLARCDRHGPAYLAGSVVVVDEAGMADTRQLSRLAAYAAAARAKLVLVGDPDQIPEVGAGGAFRHLVERAGPAVVALRENHRQSDAGDRERLRLIRDGRAAAAIASARAAGRWHTRETADAVRAALLADWYDDPGRIGTDKLMVATTVAEVERLNAAARALLAADGHLGTEALVVNLWAPDRALAERELRVGDRVRATRNLYPADLLTGKTGTVVAVDPGRFEVTVALDRVGEGPERWVRLDRAYLAERRVARGPGVVDWERPGLTHAYASTANAVQGRTSARAYVLVTEAGLYRQAAYVAASRARLETHYYAVTVPDVDELARHERTGASPEPEPGDVAALAEAMARDGSQTMASVADPQAVEVGPLLAVPTPWLWAERERLAVRLGAPVPLPEGLRQVRTRVAAAYGLSAEALECGPLTEAMTRALQVPNATPGRLATLMLRRHQAVTRELDSARDPIAVLVWAAGDHAVKVLTEEASARHDGCSAEEPAAGAADEARLRLLDAALARQREGRLTLLAAEPHSPAAALLGPLPHHPAGARAWRGAAAAILDYRDAAGIFDRHLDGDGPLHRSLGPRPADPGLGRHYDQVRARAAAARAVILRADLARHAPESGERTEPAIAGLAQRCLADLERDLVPKPAAANSPCLAAGGALRQPGRQEARAAAPAPTAPPGLVAAAVTLRERLLRSEVLEHMSNWVLRDVATRTAGDRPCTHDAARLAKTYGDIAVDLDRRGLGVGELSDDALVRTLGVLDSRLARAARPYADPTLAPEYGLSL